MTKSTLSGRWPTRRQVVRFMEVPLVRRIATVALAFGVLALYRTLAININFLSPITNVMEDFSMTDIYYQINHWISEDVDTSRVVTIVDLTDLHHRDEIAQAIEDIEAQHPRVLGIDAVFEGEHDDVMGDMDLRRTITCYDNIVCSSVLGKYVDDRVGYLGSEVTHPFFYEDLNQPGGSSEAFTNMPRMLYGGTKRKVSLAAPIDGELHPSFCLSVANRFNRDVDQVAMENRELNINFDSKDFAVLRPDEVSRHPELIEDHVVLFGAVNEFVDMHYTPLGQMAGVKLLAYAVETLIQQNEVRTLPAWVFYPLCFLFVLGMRWVEERFAARTGRARNPFVKHFVGSAYGVTILYFLMTTVLVGLFYIIYFYTNFSISLAAPLAATAFLGASNGFYKACIHTLLARRSPSASSATMESVTTTLNREGALAADVQAAPDGSDPGAAGDFGGVDDLGADVGAADFGGFDDPTPFGQH